MKVIAAGHSHICALRDGYFTDRPSDLDIDFVDLLSEEFRTIDGLDDPAAEGSGSGGELAEMRRLVEVDCEEAFLDADAQAHSTTG